MRRAVVRGGAPALVLASLSLLLGCTSPEASRERGGAPGGDTGNRSELVQMHEGSQPYYRTPRQIEPFGLEELGPARQARQVTRRDGQ